MLFQSVTTLLTIYVLKVSRDFCFFIIIRVYPLIFRRIGFSRDCSHAAERIAVNACQRLSHILPQGLSPSGRDFETRMNPWLFSDFRADIFLCGDLDLILINFYDLWINLILYGVHSCLNGAGSRPCSLYCPMKIPTGPICLKKCTIVIAAFLPRCRAAARLCICSCAPGPRL